MRFDTISDNTSTSYISPAGTPVGRMDSMVYYGCVVYDATQEMPEGYELSIEQRHALQGLCVGIPVTCVPHPACKNMFAPCTWPHQKKGTTVLQSKTPTI